MARTCMVTGKGTTRGNKVAHSNIKTRRDFKTNVRWKRFWVATENRFVRIFVSSHGMRIIDKVGVESVLLDLRARGEKV